MSRAWIPYLLIGPFAVGTFVSACSAGGDLGKKDSESTGSGSTSSSGGTRSIAPTGAGGATGGSIKVGEPVDPCELAGDTDPNCMVMHQPGCGDGEVNTANEVCDDGNNKPGDCCSGTCQVEPFCDCSSGTCVSTIICGDGMRGPGEACDDANPTSGDGCSSDCRVVEIGYRCQVPGQPCERHYVCGDGSPDANEGCDDGGVTPGDGCSERCRIEIGFKCDGAPSACTATTCGDGVQEGAESCDDSNILPFDGCTPDCRAEPACVTGMACTSGCGDGIVFGTEACDDGNLRPGDGCSATCTQEEGYICNNDAPCTKQMGVDAATGQMGDICTLTVPAVFRDFNANGQPNGHPDFAPGYNHEGASQGLVKNMLDAQGKPESNGPDTDAFLHTAADFAKWYRDGAPASAPIASSITLWDRDGIAGTGANGYVNRWGALGETWDAPAAFDNIEYGGPGGTGCEACVPSAIGMCYDPCIPWGNGNAQACCADPATNGFDGNPLFFPIDTTPGILMETRQEAKVPEQYGWVGWPWEDEVATSLGVLTPIPTSTAPFPTALHNFNFTTEVKYWFKYDPAVEASLDFTGDDDVWVFLNGRLAIDLGAWHVPLNGTLTIGADIATTTNLDVLMPPTVVRRTQPAAMFGLEAGNVYQIAVFHAERQKEGSSFKLTLAGFNANPSDCRTNCGDGMVGPGEECDDGTNRGGYNECAPECVLGPRCGDAIPQPEYEQCDDGVNAGTYGGCGPDCMPGPHCGDSVVTDGEQCDDGMNLGNYGGCDAGCVIGPHCGDGFITTAINDATGQPFEGCDDGNTTSDDGCSNCLVDIIVPR